jgi:hypothetical protein
VNAARAKRRAVPVIAEGKIGKDFFALRSKKTFAAKIY